jgi:hypothetical protein
MRNPLESIASQKFPMSLIILAVSLGEMDMGLKASPKQ